MKNRKYILNRERLTKTEIEQYKDFDKVLAKVSAGSGTGTTAKGKVLTLKTALIVGGIGLAASLTLITLFRAYDPASNTGITTNSDESKIKKEKLRVSAPFPELDVAYEVYVVDPVVKTEIETRNGSIVSIDKNSFVTSAGQKPKGAVTIRYREFHNPVEIFRAGIPLEYDSGGMDFTFVSAGMFEIAAFEGEEPLEVVDGKALTVDLVTMDSSSGFNSYYLDTAIGNWVFLEQSKAKPENKAELIADNRPAPSREIRTIHEELIGNTVEPIEPKAPAFPKMPKGKFSYPNSFSKDFPEIPRNARLVVDDELSEFSSIYYDVQWDKVELTKSTFPNRYTLVLTKGAKVIKVESYPALEEDNYDKAWAEYEKAKAAYEKYVQERANATRTTTGYTQEEIAQMAAAQGLDADVFKILNEQPNNKFKAIKNKLGLKMRRTFSVQAFGVYNSDHPKVRRLIFPSGVIVVPVLVDKLKEKIEYFKGNNSVTGINTILTFYNNGNTVISKGRTNVFWAVTKDLKIAIVEDFDPMRVQGTAKITCQLYLPEEGIKKLDSMLNGKP